MTDRAHILNFAVVKDYMMNAVKNIKEALKQWRMHCQEVQTATSFIPKETPKEKQHRIDTLRKDYDAFVRYYFPHYCKDDKGNIVPSAHFHIKAAQEILANRTIKSAYVWHRGAAKSTHMDIFVPLWLKCQQNKSLNVMVVVSKSEDAAKTLLGDLQAELQYNKRYIYDYGEQYNNGSWETGEFVTKDGTAFFARGRGQSPRGLRYRNNRPDYIVIDDIDDDELVLNPQRVRKLTLWVKEALFGALDAGRGRFIMVGNLISKTSVLQNFITSKGVRVSRVNILDKDGKPAWKEKYTIEEVRAIEDFQGYRSFQREFMNNPITDGAIFKQEWIRFKKLPPLEQYDSLVLYIDPSFKGSSKNDYKACKLWGRHRSELHHIDAFVRQCSIGEMVRWCYDLYEWAEDNNVVIKFFMEAGFMQDIILEDFIAEGETRGYQLPLRKDMRKKPDKHQRIEQSSVLWERGIIYYNKDKEEDPDMQRGIEQTLAFEKGMRSHDDAPDADEGAIWILQRESRISRNPPRIGRLQFKSPAW